MSLHRYFLSLVSNWNILSTFSFLSIAISRFFQLIYFLLSNADLINKQQRKQKSTLKRSVQIIQSRVNDPSFAIFLENIVSLKRRSLFYFYFAFPHPNVSTVCFNSKSFCFLISFLFF